MRLFLGTFLEQAERNQVAEFQRLNRQLKEDATLRLNWVKPEKLHMTWCFLGELPPERLSLLGAAVKQALAEFILENEAAAKAPLNVSFDQPAFWPDKKHPSYFVIQPSELSRQCQSLGSLLRAHTLDFCQLHENKAFKPHLTLARLGAHTSFAGLERLLPLEMRLRSIDVVLSQRGTNGQEYRTLKSFAPPDC